jgi:exopolysaccharide biosynthesis polyprenyl glycosylphosphotransferase
MRSVEVAGHPKRDALAPGRWRAWWSTRGETIELAFYFVLVPLDLLAVLAAFSTALQIPRWTGASVTESSWQFIPAFLLISPLWVAVFALVGLYSEAGVRNRWSEAGKVFVAASGPAMLLTAVDSLRHGAMFPTQQLPVYGYLLSFVFVLVGRNVVHGLQHALFARDLGVHRALVIGSGPVAQHIVRTLGMTRRTGYRVVGVLDEAEALRGSVLATLPSYRSVAEADKALGGRFDEIIHADSSLPRDDILEILKFANDHHLSYRFVPHQSGLYAPDTVVSTLAGVAVIKIRQTPLEGWGRIIKRGFDIVGAACGLLLIAPLLAVIAAVIAVADGVPVMFRQERLARGGETFRILKFRTMRTAYSGRPALEVFRELGRDDLAEEFVRDQKVKNDPRVSRLGVFLRRTSLDELPQLWNVLRGDLSLVGPRPIVRDELVKFGEFTGTILALKPGITGLWQTSGRSDISYEERVKLNIQYVESWSLRLDVLILLRTLALVVRGGGGAY